MTRDDQTVYEEIKALISFMVGRLAEKDTPGGSRGELMWQSDGSVIITHTIKNAKMTVRGC
jgi:hypothetical protein